MTEKIKSENMNIISGIEPQENSARFRLSALNWFNLGLNVLPTRDKRPLVKWEEWQNRKQSMPDLEFMPWQNANGYAVVCGLENKINFDGVQKKVFLGVIDIDDKDTFDFSAFPETFIEKTPHGFHLFYWSECPVDAIKYQGFELLGSGNICCIYDNPFTETKIALHPDVKAQFEYNYTHLEVCASEQNSRHMRNQRITTVELLKEDIPEGQRDSTAIYLASKLRIEGKTKDESLVLMLEWNEKHCIPPLSDEIIIQKIESAFKNDKPYFEDLEPKFERVELRDEVFQELISHKHFATLPNEEIFLYAEGVYSKQPVKAIIKSSTAKRFGKHYLKEDTEQILDRVKAETFKDPDFFKNIPLNYVCIENGIMELQSGQLKPHDPSVPFLNKIPVRFDSKAKCQLIDEKMHEWLESEDHVSAMYEFIGYCLWREYTYQNAFFFVGEGENGKTTLLKLITAFLGSDNVSNIPIQDLSDEFKTVNLFGKLANIADELSSKSLEDTSKFKQLTGESPMSGSRKYVQDPTQFISYAKQLYATNELPRTSDKSHAFFRRPVIFKFAKTFTIENGNKDPNLLKKLTTPEELSGLMNKAIEGLKRLQERKAFSIQPSSADTEELWTTDTIQEFTFNCLEESSKNECLAYVDVYKAYEEYCQNRSVQASSKESFALKLKKYIQFERHRKMVKNTREYYYYGIKLKGDLETQKRLDQSQSSFCK